MTKHRTRLSKVLLQIIRRMAHERLAPVTDPFRAKFTQQHGVKSLKIETRPNFSVLGARKEFRSSLLTTECSGTNSGDQIEESLVKWPLKVRNSNCPLLKIEEFWKSRSFLWTPEFCLSCFTSECWVLEKLSDFTPCCRALTWLVLVLDVSVCNRLSSLSFVNVTSSCSCVPWALSQTRLQTTLISNTAMSGHSPFLWSAERLPEFIVSIHEIITPRDKCHTRQVTMPGLPPPVWIVWHHTCWWPKCAHFIWVILRWLKPLTQLGLLCLWSRHQRAVGLLPVLLVKGALSKSVSKAASFTCGGSHSSMGCASKAICMWLSQIFLCLLHRQPAHVDATVGFQRGSPSCKSLAHVAPRKHNWHSGFHAKLSSNLVVFGSHLGGFVVGLQWPMIALHSTCEVICPGNLQGHLLGWWIWLCVLGQCPWFCAASTAQRRTKRSSEAFALQTSCLQQCQLLVCCLCTHVWVPPWGNLTLAWCCSNVLLCCFRSCHHGTEFFFGGTACGWQGLCVSQWGPRCSCENSGKSAFWHCVFCSCSETKQSHWWHAISLKGSPGDTKGFFSNTRLTIIMRIFLKIVDCFAQNTQVSKLLLDAKSLSAWWTTLKHWKNLSSVKIACHCSNERTWWRVCFWWALILLQSWFNSGTSEAHQSVEVQVIESAVWEFVVIAFTIVDTSWAPWNGWHWQSHCVSTQTCVVEGMGVKCELGAQHCGEMADNDAMDIACVLNKKVERSLCWFITIIPRTGISHKSQCLPKEFHNQLFHVWLLDQQEDAFWKDHNSFEKEMGYRHSELKMNTVGFTHLFCNVSLTRHVISSLKKAASVDQGMQNRNNSAAFFLNFTNCPENQLWCRRPSLIVRWFPQKIIWYFCLKRII